MERLERAEFVQFQARCLDTFFSLAKGEQSERRLFEQLPVDTYDALTAEGIHLLAAFDPQTNFLQHLPQWHDAVPPSLLERWKDWSARRHELIQRNPRLELREMMHQKPARQHRGPSNKRKQFKIGSMVARLGRCHLSTTKALSLPSSTTACAS